ncbi:MAG TPA: hypothetical protein VLY04_19325 [Bryobacteraceae bacterium]|nr:hypothetical protein [Bryobacteraceae bacterium]
MAASVSIADTVPSRKRLVQATALAWFAIIGLDLLMNAGLFAPFYRWDQPGLLPPLKMFQYLPLGYAAFLLWSIALAWLVLRTRSYGIAAGARFGAILGGLLGAAALVGWLSIFAFPPLMLFLWALDHAVCFTAAGAVIGGSLSAPRLRPMVRRVFVLVGLCVAVTIAMQSLGLAPVNVPHGRISVGWDPNK